MSLRHSIPKTNTSPWIIPTADYYIIFYLYQHGNFYNHRIRCAPISVRYFTTILVDIKAS